MKKLISILLLGLLLGGCIQNFKEFSKMGANERDKMLYDRDFRTNLFEGDLDILYIDTRAVSTNGKPSLSYRTSHTNFLTGKVYLQNMSNTARRICKREMKKDAANFLGTRIMTKDEIKKFTLFGMEYDFFKCTKSQDEIVKKKLEKLQNEQGNNTLNRSFTCSFGYDLSEKSKIEIRGNTATEITAVGISINYSIVNISNKGAFTLEGSSKDGRVWFIGAKSFLILDVKLLPYDCK